MEVLGVLVFLLLMKNTDSTPAPTPAPEPTPHDGASSPPKPDVGQIAQFAAGLLGPTIGIIKTLTAAAPSSAAGGGAGAGSGAGAGGGSSATSPATSIAAGFWASGAGGALTFLAIAAAIISIVLTQKQNAYDKEFKKKLGRGRPNPRSLVDFEELMLEKLRSVESTPVASVRDLRLDVTLDDVGYQSVRQGKRNIYSLTTVIARRIRSMAYEYLRERHRYSYRLRQHWPSANVPTKTLEAEWSESFSDPMGYANVPLLTGATQIPRVDTNDPYPRDNREQLQPTPIVLSGDWSLQPGDRIIARLLGLLHAIGMINADPAAYIYLDRAGWRREYRDRIWNALELTDDDATKTDWVDASKGTGNTWRFGFVTKASKWGLRVRVDCDDPKANGTSHAFLDNLGDTSSLSAAGVDARKSLEALATNDASTIPTSPNNSISNIR